MTSDSLVPPIIANIQPLFITPSTNLLLNTFPDKEQPVNTHQNWQKNLPIYPPLNSGQPLPLFITWLVKSYPKQLPAQRNKLLTHPRNSRIALPETSERFLDIRSWQNSSRPPPPHPHQSMLPWILKIQTTGC